MFFCPGSIGLLDDDDDADWDIDSHYYHQHHHHPSSIHAFHHADVDSKFSKMGSLMFVVLDGSPPFLLVPEKKVFTSQKKPVGSIFCSPVIIS